MIFGIPTHRHSADLVLIPVPWEVTTSYGAGTAEGPDLILRASPQLDLFRLDHPELSHLSIFMEPVNQALRELSATYSEKVRALRANYDLTQTHEDAQLKTELKAINEACYQMNLWVEEQVSEVLRENKLVGVIGGDHSISFGAIKAVARHYGSQNLGILHLDAHADLRHQYEGLAFSHASIMNNVVTSSFAPKTLVQVAIRDFCEEEFKFIQQHSSQVHTFFDFHLKKRLFGGTPFQELVQEIIALLPDQVYVSMDIDGLSPLYCPGTGTPVPGGLSFDQVLLFFSLLAEKRKIVGFDLVEVASRNPNSEWDGNVGARLTLALSHFMALSQRKLPS